MEFSPYSPSDYYGVVVLNLVRLENYIAGVCAAEISTWWPIETLKAFSIAVRSYSLKRLNGHGAFNGDLCNESCCQVFNGYGPTDDRVWRAVGETKGVIATSNGILCGTYYSSSTGGCTANCTDVWGSSLATYPYLKAVATPWEKYSTYNRGEKTSTVTGTALYNLLENKGYTALTGAVTKVEITKTGNNSTYVTEIKFYDAKGNCQTVTRADRIKKLLSSYVDSANFVVAKSGETITRVKYTMLGFGATNPNPSEGVDVLGDPFLNTVLGRQQFNVLTESGLKTFYDSQSEKVMTDSGLKDFNMSYALDSQIYPTIIGINGELLPDISQLSAIIESETITTTYAADSFTFISRGWGHGVGMSQYGIYELGNLGYDYRYILKAYYSGITYTTYKEYLNK
jgi:stage II sporulation protein D